MSSRRRMPPEYVLANAVGGTDELEPLEQLVGTEARLRRVGLVEEPADVDEVLAPGEALVDRGVLAR